MKIHTRNAPTPTHVRIATRARALCLAAPLLALGTSCIYVDDDHWHDPTIQEVEPNDVYWSAMDLGTLGVGERVLLAGHVADAGFDRYDGFAFRSEQPMDVEFTLTADDPYDDFDLELFDPATLTTIAVWQSPANPEGGVFSIHTTALEFHLVVSSFRGVGGYTLEVRGTGLGWGGDGPEQGGFQAQGSEPRGERAVDWAPYAAAAAAAPSPVTAQILELDPATGRVLGARQARLEEDQTLDATAAEARAVNGG